MSNFQDIMKQKGVPIKNMKKRKKYSKDDSEPLNLIFTIKPMNTSESSDESTIEDSTIDESISDSSSDQEFVFNFKSSTKHLKELNYNKYIKLIAKKNKTISDYQYFMSLSVDEQTNILHKLKNIYTTNPSNEIPFQFKILNLSIPDKYKHILLNKHTQQSNLMPFDPSYHKLKLWIDSFLNIPFDQYSNLPISIHDGIESCQEFMENAKTILNETVYGLNDVKYQIMQFVGQYISNPSSIGSAIAIKGPMGTGKTTLIKNGISKILNRPFELIPLGGATDGCYLDGHSYTYEGSTYGKIVDILIKTKCMNPIIYFDELDKVSTTPKGQEIIGVLTHLIDTSQNDKFHDRYFSELDFDLSKCLFIFSYNDESLVNPILKDRMYTITVNGYDSKDKLMIAKDYLIPSIRNTISLDDIIIPNETIQYIIEHHSSEKGVRDLKRCIETIYLKLNLFRFIKPSNTLFDEQLLNIQYPFTVTIDVVKILIKENKLEHPYNNLYL